MIDVSYKIDYQAPIFNYIETVDVDDFNLYNESLIASIDLFENLKLIFIYRKGLIYEELYCKDYEIQSFGRNYKEINESDVLNSFYSIIYFMLSDADSFHLDEKFNEMKSNTEFVEKIQLFILTNPSNYLKLNLYELKNYYLFLYGNFKTNESSVIILNKDEFKNKYLLLNTYSEEHFIIKENIIKNEFWLFINEYSRNITDDSTLKNQLENFLLLSIC